MKTPPAPHPLDGTMPIGPFIIKDLIKYRNHTVFFITQVDDFYLLLDIYRRFF